MLFFCRWCCCVRGQMIRTVLCCCYEQKDASVGKKNAMGAVAGTKMLSGCTHRWLNSCFVWWNGFLLTQHDSSKTIRTRASNQWIETTTWIRCQMVLTHVWQVLGTLVTLRAEVGKVKVGFNGWTKNMWSHGLRRCYPAEYEAHRKPLLVYLNKWIHDRGCCVTQFFFFRF